MSILSKETEFPLYTKIKDKNKTEYYYYVNDKFYLMIDWNKKTIQSHYSSDGVFIDTSVEYKITRQEFSSVCGDFLKSQELVDLFGVNYKTTTLKDNGFENKTTNAKKSTILFSEEERNELIGKNSELDCKLNDLQEILTLEKAMYDEKVEHIFELEQLLKRYL